MIREVKWQPQYGHSLQAATRAYEDGADEEVVVTALLHDIGDPIAPENHSAVAAAILRPYVSDKTYWIVMHHGLFQGYYYLHHFGKDRNARDMYRDTTYYQACVDFCAKYDQCAFDPDFISRPLDFFEPMVLRLFARKPFSASKMVLEGGTLPDVGYTQEGDTSYHLRTRLHTYGMVDRLRAREVKGRFLTVDGVH